MKKRFYLQGSGYIFLMFTALMSVAGIFAQESNQQFFKYKVDANRSLLHFEKPENGAVKLLNTSPAPKIILKINSSQGEIAAGLQPDGIFPGNSALKSLIITPMGGQNYLFTFELKESMGFNWDAETNRLIISDAQYVDLKNKKYYQAINYQKKGELQKALALYRSIIFQNRKNGNAYYKAAQVREALQQYRLAEINYMHALRLKCDSLSLYKDLAHFYEKRGNRQESAKYAKIYADNMPRQEIAIELPVEPENLLTSAADAVYKDNSAVQKIPGKITDNVTSVQENTTSIEAKSGFSFAHLMYASGGFLFLMSLLTAIYLYRKNNFNAKIKKISIVNTPNTEQQRLQQQKLLETMQRIAATVEDEPAAVINDTAEDHSVNQLLEPESLEMLRKRSPFLLDEEYTVPEKKEMAKNLNLGIGEVELALNLKAHQRNVNRTISVESEIEKMFDAHMGISEIARKMHMGQGEVQLLLKMRNSDKKQEVTLVS